MTLHAPEAVTPAVWGAVKIAACINVQGIVQALVAALRLEAQAIMVEVAPPLQVALPAKIAVAGVKIHVPEDVNNLVKEDAKKHVLQHAKALVVLLVQGTVTKDVRVRAIRDAPVHVIAAVKALAQPGVHLAPAHVIHHVQAVGIPVLGPVWDPVWAMYIFTNGVAYD